MCRNASTMVEYDVNYHILEDKTPSYKRLKNIEQLLSYPSASRYARS
jgi:hypothetical protein